MLRIRVYDNQEEVFYDTFDSAVEFGRQSTDEETLFSLTCGADCSRLIIANREERGVSRKHVLLEAREEDKVWIKNLSTSLAIGLQDRELEPSSAAEVSVPVLITIGSKAIRVQGPETEESSTELQSLIEPTVPPSDLGSGTSFPALNERRSSVSESERLVRWVQTSMGVFQSAATSKDFFEKAARAIVEMAQLDTGRVLLFEDGERWRTEAAWPPASEDDEWAPSRRVLAAVREQKRTFWELPVVGDRMESLAGVTVVVAAPILDREESVIGVLYGVRSQASGLAIIEPITRLQALMVELIASAVAAGLSRLDQERVAIAATVQFEQFFSPELAQQLTKQPDLLDGRQANISVLFCDIPGFSRISERLDPVKTMQWISDVMDAISRCVRNHDGVLVDYIGDELMAMWGAPEEQPDHAELACRAGLEMLEQLPELNDRWQSTLEEPMGLGIGINSGIAQVGNTGSQYKFKYGPLGSNVNLASRVQGATKYLRTRLLITAATQSQIDASFATRRLRRVRVVNMEEPVELFELAAGDFPGWSDLKTGYEEALEQFEKQNFQRAAQIVGNLLTEHQDDGPSVLLLSRSAEYMMEPSKFESVLTLPGK